MVNLASSSGKSIGSSGPDFPIVSATQNIQPYLANESPYEHNSLKIPNVKFDINVLIGNSRLGF